VGGDGEEGRNPRTDVSPKRTVSAAATVFARHASATKFGTRYARSWRYEHVPEFLRLLSMESLSIFLYFEILVVEDPVLDPSIDC
jgi:hypothetical protein